MNYLKVATEIANLLTEKNQAYGDAISRTARIMEILYPAGIHETNYGNALVIVRIIDKLCRQSVTPDPENWKDICGYALRMISK